MHVFIRDRNLARSTARLDFSFAQYFYWVSKSTQFSIINPGREGDQLIVFDKNCVAKQNLKREGKIRVEK